MPQSEYIPADDELTLLDDGTYVLPGVLVVTLRIGTEDLEGTIVEIADLYEGSVIGAFVDLRRYQLRLVGYDLEALTILAETVAARPDVDFASPYYFLTLETGI